MGMYALSVLIIAAWLAMAVALVYFFSDGWKYVLGLIAFSILVDVVRGLPHLFRQKQASVPEQHGIHAKDDH